MTDLKSAPAIGSMLIYKPTGELFKVLCSCPRSRPKHHTRAHIQRNLAMYEYPPVEKNDAS